MSPAHVSGDIGFCDAGHHVAPSSGLEHITLLHRPGLRSFCSRHAEQAIADVAALAVMSGMSDEEIRDRSHRPGDRPYEAELVALAHLFGEWRADGTCRGGAAAAC